MMKRSKKQWAMRWAAFVAGLIMACVVQNAQADASSDYPDKPVRIVLGYPPGGLADNLGRMLAESLGARYKQSFIVENKPGASGTIATSFVARSAPDGYTLFMGDTTLSSVSMKGQLSYDPIKDFEAVHLLVEVPTVLVVNKNLPVKSLADLIKLAKSSPGKLNYATYGVATSSNLNSVLLKKEAGIDVQQITYSGSGPAMLALRAGDVQIMFDTLASAYPQIKAGEVRPLAVTGGRRLPLIANVPTMAESGLPNVGITSLMGVMAPRGTDPKIVESLEKAVQSMLTEPSVKEKLDSFGLLQGEASGDAYKKLMQDSIDKTQQVVDDAHIKFN